MAGPLRSLAMRDANPSPPQKTHGGNSSDLSTKSKRFGRFAPWDNLCLFSVFPENENDDVCPNFPDWASAGFCRELFCPKAISRSTLYRHQQAPSQGRGGRGQGSGAEPEGATGFDGACSLLWRAAARRRPPLLAVERASFGSHEYSRAHPEPRSLRALQARAHRRAGERERQKVSDKESQRRNRRRPRLRSHAASTRAPRTSPRNAERSRLKPNFVASCAATSRQPATPSAICALPTAQGS